MKGMDVLNALRGLIAYDKDGNLLGPIAGGTSNRDPQEPWTEHNTEVFISNKEIHLKNIFIKESDIEQKLAKWKSQVRSIQQEMLKEEDIRGISFLAKEIVTICEWSQILTEYSKDNEENILN